MNQLTLGSLFSGLGGFEYAALLCGIRPVWASEVEPLCIAVTRRHFPDMIHLGDISAINGADIPPVEIIAFGSPCQDMSVAGKREGMKHTDNGDDETTRSGLFTEAIRIIYEMRKATNGSYPTYVIWENVPGAYSSNRGRDFKTVLEQITKTDIPMPASERWANAGVVRSGGIRIGWRTLDAQYWGVPQRRKRIFLIGYFGSDCAEEILFKPDGVQRYLAPRGTPREGAAADVETSVGKRGYIFDARGNGDGDIAPTIIGDHNGWITDYTVHLAKNVIPVNTQIATRYNKLGERTGLGIGNIGDPANTLQAARSHAVIYALDRSSFNQGKNAQYDFKISDNGISPPIIAKGAPAVSYETDLEWIVRRLTPLECERLQGFPDNWTSLPKIDDMTDEEYKFFLNVFITDKKIRGVTIKNPPSKRSLIKWYNKLDCDGNRHKALGNSLAIPCALRVMRGIADHEKEKTE